MQAEFIIPVVLGGLVALVGVGLVFDAWTDDETVIPRERRRHPRIERHRNGEGLLGLGVISLGAALIGRDTWSYRTIAVILGTVLVLWGAILNRHFLSAAIANRGKLRRGAPESVTKPMQPRPVEKQTPLATSSQPADVQPPGTSTPPQPNPPDGEKRLRIR